MPLEQAISRASYLASWSGACGWKRARWAFLADLVILSGIRLYELPRARVVC